MEKKKPREKHRTWKDICSVLKLTGKWAYNLRSLILAIPVFVCAVCLAIRNAALLPATVGIGIMQKNGYPIMVDRGIAVLAPLLITVVCLLLMACSKKILYPWMVSVLSLMLPVMIWIVNLF